MPSRNSSRHWQKAAIKRLESAAIDPDAPADLPDIGIIEFAESSEWCGLELYPRQRELLADFWNDRFTTAVWALGRRSGENLAIVDFRPLRRNDTRPLVSFPFAPRREILRFVGGKRSVSVEDRLLKRSPVD